LLFLAALAGLVAAGIRSRRRDIAAAALIALALMASLFAVTASSPGHGLLFATISYTIWWASPAGMFAWLVLGFGAVTLLLASDRVGAPRVRALSARVAGPATAAGLVAVAVIGAVVAAGENRNRLETLFRPARAVADHVRADAPRGATVLITGDRNEIALGLQSAVAYAMRDEGLSFVNSSLPGIGTRYDPARHPHDMVMTVTEHPVAGDPVFAREVLVNVPANGPPSRRTFYVTLTRR
jgi:hypothetical protein